MRLGRLVGMAVHMKPQLEACLSVRRFNYAPYEIDSLDNAAVRDRACQHVSSQMSRFDWRYAPIVVAAVSESNWRVNELDWVGVVEGR